MNKRAFLVEYSVPVAYQDTKNLVFQRPRMHVVHATSKNDAMKRIAPHLPPFDPETMFVFVDQKLITTGLHSEKTLRTYFGLRATLLTTKRGVTFLPEDLACV